MWILRFYTRGAAAVACTDDKEGKEDWGGGGVKVLLLDVKCISQFVYCICSSIQIPLNLFLVISHMCLDTSRKERMSKVEICHPNCVCVYETLPLTAATQ